MRINRTAFRVIPILTFLALHVTWYSVMVAGFSGGRTETLRHGTSPRRFSGGYYSTASMQCSKPSRDAHQICLGTRLLHAEPHHGTPGTAGPRCVQCNWLPAAGASSAAKNSASICVMVSRTFSVCQVFSLYFFVGLISVLFGKISWSFHTTPSPRWLNDIVCMSTGNHRGSSPSNSVSNYVSKRRKFI